RLPIPAIPIVNSNPVDICINYSLSNYMTYSKRCSSVTQERAPSHYHLYWYLNRPPGATSPLM
ncbi:MAG: hypothetical protein IKP58_18890, partial [Victivallales bacterium]|nr:hypothetical protein [Victivallales bacterium]